MTTNALSAKSVPRWVSLFTPVASRLLRTGLPLGFNGLVTIAGQKTGLPRTTPVAVIEASGRRWIWAPWGEVHWVQNLRVARRATISRRGRIEDVEATELDSSGRLAFFRDVLGPLARSIPSAPGSFESSTASTSTTLWKRPATDPYSSFIRFPSRAPTDPESQ